MEVAVRGLDEVRDVPQPADTRHFLFAQEDGHLVVREPVRDDAASEAVSATAVPPLSAETITMPGRPERVLVLRAQHVSTRADDRYILLKKYEGVVTSRGKQSFTARLFENVSDYPVVEAEFDLEELSEPDRGLAVEGAGLVWTIGYRYDGSTRKRESAIYLRRLPSWSDKEIEQSSRAAEELTRGIQWE
ncbi:MAG: hypothetical protein ABSF95_11385 [Verrucomicrobiota bacterium]|jgi:hypothetical protein